MEISGLQICNNYFNHLVLGHFLRCNHTYYSPYRELEKQLIEAIDYMKAALEYEASRTKTL